MITPNDPHNQAPNAPTAPTRTTPPSAALALPPANDAEPGPACCPTCGRPYFGPASSQLLDLVVSAHAAIADVKAALERVVVP
jgi:hypothetical protein